MEHRDFSPRYVVISPVKDEARYVHRTIHSMIAQTVRPLRWIVVDDGSSDGTADLVGEYLGEHPWIQLVCRTQQGQRQPGSGVIRAFNTGYDLLKGAAYDYIVKLDCDLELPEDYFERLLGQFRDNPRLGIASGVYCEEHAGRWLPVTMPRYHAAGACKVVRAACFEGIGGFVASKGWDTLDEIKAQVQGWSTQHFAGIQFKHLKKEGSAIGPLATNVMHGEIYYLTGGSRLFLLFKILSRMATGRPVLLAGLALAWGFIKFAIRGVPRLVTDQEARYYSRLLNARIRERLFRGSGHTVPIS